MNYTYSKWKQLQTGWQSCRFHRCSINIDRHQLSHGSLQPNLCTTIHFPIVFCCIDPCRKQKQKQKQINRDINFNWRGAARIYRGCDFATHRNVSPTMPISCPSGPLHRMFGNKSSRFLWFFRLIGALSAFTSTISPSHGNRTECPSATTKLLGSTVNRNADKEKNKINRNRNWLSEHFCVFFRWLGFDNLDFKWIYQQRIIIEQSTGSARKRKSIFNKFLLKWKW